MSEASVSSIVEQLHALGVKRGGVLLAHTSFKAVGPVAGGPRGLIDALRTVLGPNGTLVMPSWTGDDETPFDPKTTPASRDLGVVAGTFWREPGVLRSDHPVAFAAVGPRAAEIVSGPLPVPPHIPESPIGHVHDASGQVLLIGVGHDANTTLHLAEVLAKVPYGTPKHITVLKDGRPVRVDYKENDHCCQRFALADDWLRKRGWQSEGLVGQAPSRLFASRDLVSVALRQLARDPLIFLHPTSAGCEECDAARASVGRQEPAAMVKSSGSTKADQNDYSDTFDLFHRAIFDRKQVVCSYGGYSREVCPYILGHSGGREAALVFQFGGTSSKGLPKVGAWRCFYLDDVRDAALRDGPWYGGAEHRSQQSCVEHVFIDVNTDVPDQPGRKAPPR